VPTLHGWAFSFPPQPSRDRQGVGPVVLAFDECQERKHSWCRALFNQAKPASAPQPNLPTDHFSPTGKLEYMHPSGKSARQIAQQLTWRERLASLRNVRPLLAMVWETSPPLVVASVVFRLFRALLPLAMLWVSKLIIDGVVAGISHKSGSPLGVWKLVGVELSLAIVSDGIRITSPLPGP